LKSIDSLRLESSPVPPARPTKQRVGTFDGIKQLHKLGAVGRWRVVVDEVSSTLERPTDLQSFRLISDALNHCIDSSGNQGGFAESE
jgi:hypothetical protein